MRPKKFNSNAEKQKAWREKRGDQPIVTPEPIAPSYLFWDKDRFPEKRAWDAAVVRADRAKRYAEKFPQFVSPKDLIFQTIDWQYERELRHTQPKVTHFVT